MKILSVSLCYPSPDQPDQGIFVQRRLAALAARPGVEVSVLSPRPWCPLIRPCPPVPPQTHPVPAEFPRLPGWPILNWATDGWACSRTVMRRIKREKFDLIDAHFVYPEGVGALLAARRMGIPVVVTVRGKIVSLSRRPVRRAQIRAMLRCVDGCIAVSESLARWVRHVAGKDVPVEVIPNGIDPAAFRLIPRNEARSALGWDPSVRYVLAVGHLQRLKGFDRLVRIWPTVRRRIGDARLILAGSRRGERRFRRRLLEDVATLAAHDCAEGRAPSIQFTGPVPAARLNLMYNAADVMVNSSRSEGWCNAVAEALAAGTPVVATDVGGNREQIVSEALGLVVPDGAERALADAIVEALRRRWDRRRIAAHGSARTWDQVAEQVHHVFERVVKAARAPHGAQHTPRRVPAAGSTSTVIEVPR